MINSMLGQAKRNCDIFQKYFEITDISVLSTCEMEKDSLFRVYGFYDSKGTIGIRLK